jgi:hypothetical protein
MPIVSRQVDASGVRLAFPGSVDYGEIIGGAWRMTSRNRGLWLLGLFAGSASGSCNGTSFNSGPPAGSESTGTFGTSLDTYVDAIVAGIAAILPFLIVIGVILAVVWLAFWLLSVACTAAVIAGGGEAAAGRRVTLGAAWSRGSSAFGRLFSLQLMWLVLWIVVIGSILLLAINSLPSQPRPAAAWLRWLFNVLGVLAVVGILGSLLSIVLAYAQRAIVLDGAGALDAIGAGTGLVRQRLGTSLLVWLIGLALAIGGGIALVIGLVLVALPTLLVGAILGFLANLAGVSGLAVTFGLIALILFVALVLGSAVLNTFLWHYWTMAYLRLTGALATAAAPSPPAPENVVEPS